MLRTAFLIVDSKNIDGFIICVFAVRSMLETTNTHMTPDNRQAIFLQLYLKLTADYKSNRVFLFSLICVFIISLHQK